MGPELKKKITKTLKWLVSFAIAVLLLYLSFRSVKWTSFRRAQRMPFLAHTAIHGRQYRRLLPARGKMA